jgi:Amiloride-sensitive sodium channel
MRIDKKSESGGRLARLDWHGLLDLYTAKSWGWRVFWIAVILGCIALIAYYSHDAFDMYWNNNTATSYSVSHEKSLRLPYITLCNLGARLNSTYISHFYKSQVPGQRTSSSDEYRYFYQYLSNFFDPRVEYLLNPLVLSQDALYLRLFDNATNPTPKPVYQFLLDASLQCPDVLISCSFGAEPFNCCAGARSYFTSLGLCYQLDIPNDAQQVHAGSEGGLQVHYKLNKQLYEAASDHSEAAQYSSGLEVSFTTTQSLSPYELSAVMMSGMQNSVRLEAEELIYIPGTGKKCALQPPSLYLYENEYSENLCYFDCFHMLAIEQCRCNMIIFTGEKIRNDKYCSPLDFALCIKRYLFNPSTIEQVTFNLTVGVVCGRWVSFLIVACISNGLPTFLPLAAKVPAVPPREMSHAVQKDNFPPFNHRLPAGELGAARLG